MSILTPQDIRPIIADYCDERMADIAIAEKTALGATDNLREDEPAQKAQIMSGTTEASKIANMVFASRVKLPAVLMAAGDFYDTTQGHTRLNAIYAMNRADYYAQSTSDLKTRLTRIKHKGALINMYLQAAQKPMEIYAAFMENMA